MVRLVFLHGNIGVGVCDQCGVIQAYNNIRGYKCRVHFHQLSEDLNILK